MAQQLQIYKGPIWIQARRVVKTSDAEAPDNTEIPKPIYAQLDNP